MPSYEVLKDKRLDFYLAVPKAILPRFVGILEGGANTALKALEENPNAESEYKDSRCPLPNMTFEFGDYQYFIRRNASRYAFEEFQKAWAAFLTEGYDGDDIFGLMVHHIPYYDHYKEISGDDEFNGKIVEITYQTEWDYEAEGCECKRNVPDFASLPPDTTRELIESLFQVRDDGENPISGALFGYFAFSMEAKVAERLREALPKDMLDYLEKMNSCHAIFHDKEDANLDGCELYILYNVPLEDYKHNFVTADYKDKDELMGARFVNFLQEGADLEDYGEFSIYMSPQPGILTADENGINTFSTPWEIVYYFCGDGSQEVNLMWGNELYYTDEPFHLQIQRFINVEPQILQKARLNEINRNDFRSEAKVQKLGAMPTTPTNDKAENFKDCANLSQETTNVKRDSAKLNTSFEAFKIFLIERGYKENTAEGKPSTVYDYVKRVETICKNEGLDLDSFVVSIDRLVREYDKGGKKADQGSASHSAVINALKAFQKFVKGDALTQELSEEKAEDSVRDTGANDQRGLMADPKEAIQDDYIICCICGEKKQSLTSKHLQQHGLSTDEYKKLCGYALDQPLMSLNRFNVSRKIIEEAQKSRK